MEVTRSPAADDARAWRDVYTVSRLNREARALVEGGFPPLWVEGELSNVARPSSGHMYFSLKDAGAQVRCAMFRNRNTLLGFTPEAGMQVLARVRVSLYEARGEFQLVVEHMEEAGDGALQRAFEALKQRLSKEGLFDAEHKRGLPAWPRRIGVVTSPTGAAVRDVCQVLRRRYPAAGVLVYPVPVQGEGAAERIAAILRRASERAECDVLILARGGGSLEDLWAFNEETVARAIHDCAVPVVSGIGHEVDFTIADFVADHRAPTPSAAAEAVSPDGEAWLRHVEGIEQRLAALARSRLERLGQQLTWLGKRLAPQHPGRRLRDRAQRIDELEQRLRQARRVLHRHLAGRLREATAGLQRHEPSARIERLRARTGELDRRLRQGIRHDLERRHQRLASAGRALDTMSPLATLSRGYAIVSDAQGRILRRARDTAPGDTVEARLAAGRLSCLVKAVHDDEDSTDAD